MPNKKQTLIRFATQFAKVVGKHERLTTAEIYAAKLRQDLGNLNNRSMKGRVAKDVFDNITKMKGIRNLMVLEVLALHDVQRRQAAKEVDASFRMWALSGDLPTHETIDRLRQSLVDMQKKHELEEESITGSPNGLSSLAQIFWLEFFDKPRLQLFRDSRKTIAPHARYLLWVLRVFP